MVSIVISGNADCLTQLTLGVTFVALGVDRSMLLGKRLGVAGINDWLVFVTPVDNICNADTAMDDSSPDIVYYIFSSVEVM